MPTRVQVIKEVRSGNPGDWRLCYQWCCFVYDNGEAPQFGYRFVWRRPDDSIQPARGQARLPSLHEQLVLHAEAGHQGWGDFDADALEDARDRLVAAGCEVNFPIGYVGWPNRDTAKHSQLSSELIADANLLRSQCR